MKAKECDSKVTAFSLRVFIIISIICYAFCVTISGFCLIEKEGKGVKRSFHYICICYISSIFRMS